MKSMKVFAVGMLRDEAHAAEHLVLHLAAQGLDGALLCDHQSTDGTMEALTRAKSRLEGSGFQLEVGVAREIGFDQASKVTKLAEYAASTLGATWIVPIDGDEIWIPSNRSRRVGDLLREVSPTVNVVYGRLTNHWPTGVDDESVTCPFCRMRWRESRTTSDPKVAFRWETGTRVWAGNHGADLASGTRAVEGLEVHHFPVQTWPMFRGKATKMLVGLRAGNVSPNISANWRSWGEMLEQGREGELRDYYDRTFFRRDPARAHCIEDPVPAVEHA